MTTWFMLENRGCPAVCVYVSLYTTDTYSVLYLYKLALGTKQNKYRDADCIYCTIVTQVVLSCS